MKKIVKASLVLSMVVAMMVSATACGSSNSSSKADTSSAAAAESTAESTAEGGEESKADAAAESTADAGANSEAGAAEMDIDKDALVANAWTSGSIIKTDGTILSLDEYAAETGGDVTTMAVTVCFSADGKFVLVNAAGKNTGSYTVEGKEVKITLDNGMTSKFEMSEQDGTKVLGEEETDASTGIKGTIYAINPNVNVAEQFGEAGGEEGGEQAGEEGGEQAGEEGAEQAGEEGGEEGAEEAGEEE